MDLIDQGLGAVKKFNEDRKKDPFTRLVDDTAALKIKLYVESSKIGIELDVPHGVIGGYTEINPTYDILMSQYNLTKSAELEEYDRIASVETNADNLKAATAKVIDWNKRYHRTANKLFSQFWSCGEELKRLIKMNKDILGKELDKEKLEKLSENMATLNSLYQFFESADKSVREIIGKAEYDLTIPENIFVEKVKKAVYESIIETQEPPSQGSNDQEE